MNANDLKYSQAYVDAQQDEIERLRGAYEQERKDCLNLTEKVIPNLRAEIERLREVVTQTSKACALSLRDMRQKKDGEIERLRNDISYLESQNSKTIHRAAAEIERLRGLLREAEKMWPNPGLNSESASWYRRVRETLGE